MALLAVTAAAFAQTQSPLVVAVSPFEVRGGFTQDEADVITELFIIELAAAGTVKVVDRGSFDKIMGEMKFQTSDWSDSGKVAQFGKALNANSFIRGQMMKLGDQLVITASIVDVNTTQILSTSKMELAGIKEVTAKLPAFVQGIVRNLPKPPPPQRKNYFVGKWRAVFTEPKGDRIKKKHRLPFQPLVCILDIRENGQIFIERYDIIRHTIEEISWGRDDNNLKAGQISDWNHWTLESVNEKNEVVAIKFSLPLYHIMPYGFDKSKYDKLITARIRPQNSNTMMVDGDGLPCYFLDFTSTRNETFKEIVGHYSGYDGGTFSRMQ
jgi:TolB-like protein